METPCDSGQGPHRQGRAHPFQARFTETPYFLVLGRQGVTIKYVFTVGIVIVLNCFSTSLPGTVCSLPVRSYLSVIFLFNANN